MKAYPVANALNELASTLIFPLSPFETEYTSFSPREVAFTILNSKFSACCGNRRCTSDSIPVGDGSDGLSVQRAVGLAVAVLLAIASRPDIRPNICMIQDRMPLAILSAERQREKGEEAK